MHLGVVQPDYCVVAVRNVGCAACRMSLPADRFSRFPHEWEPCIGCCVFSGKRYARAAFVLMFSEAVVIAMRVESRSSFNAFRRFARLYPFYGSVHFDDERIAS
jgi:hypothetical protein